MANFGNHCIRVLSADQVSTAARCTAVGDGEYGTGTALRHRQLDNGLTTEGTMDNENNEQPS